MKRLARIGARRGEPIEISSRSDYIKSMAELTIDKKKF